MNKNNPNRTVTITDHEFPNLEPKRTILEPLGVHITEAHCENEDDTIEAVRGQRVIINGLMPITRRVLEALGEGATVIRLGVGVDNIDLDAARDLGVAIANVPDYGSDAVAEHTAALLLALLRKLPQLDADVRDGNWRGVEVAKPILPFSQTTIGFVGLGRIGRAVVERLRGFGFDFVVSDPVLDEEAATSLGVRLGSLGDVLSQSHAVTLHAPLTAETHHLIDAEALSKMRPGALLVNNARGGLVDAEALCEALERGHLSAAGLDVFEMEPLPADSRLRSAPNLLLTPHLAWYSEGSMERLQRLAAEEAARAVRGEPLRCRVV